MAARASVVIPLFNQVELTTACLSALERAGLDGVEVILVDNGSTDATGSLLAELDGSVRIVRNPHNLGFATACNQGAEAASHPAVVFLNNDTEVRDGWIEPLLAALEDPGVGVAGSRLLYPNGRLQHGGMTLMPGVRPVHMHRGAPGDHPAASRTRDVLFVTGACLAVRRDVFRAAGGFDHSFQNGYEDADLCLQLARRGKTARYCGDSVVTHHEGMSTGRSDAEQHNATLFRRRWAGWPSDWAERLAEDGLGEVGWSGCLWSGPLFDGTPEAAEGQRQLADLTDEGWRPLAQELIAGPAVVGAECPPHVLAALNRSGVPVPGASSVRRADRPVGAPFALPAIGWWGPLVGRSGYARAGRGMLAGAELAGITVRDNPADSPETALQFAYFPRHQDVEPELWVVHHPPLAQDGIAYWSEIGISSGRRIVGAACFECEGLPDGWAEAARNASEIWVPTGFNLRTFAQGGIDPDLLYAIPYPVDTDVFVPDGRDRGEGPVTFASVFEWTWRKGWDVLLRAWVEEFAKGENVRLRILTYRGAGALAEGDIVEQATRCIREAGADPESTADIELILDPLSERDLIELYRSADAFVLPTRGEGAGMPIIEAMACGTPTIATAWGGHEELMEPELSFPVDVAGFVEAAAEQVRDNSLYRGMRLAEPDLASLRIAMRAVAEDPAGARARAEAGRRVVEERFSIPAAGRALASRVEALTGGARLRVGA